MYEFKIRNIKNKRILKNPDKIAKKIAKTEAEFMLHPSGRMCVVDDRGYGRFADDYEPVFLNDMPEETSDGM